MSVQVTIDGRQVEAQDGALLIDVCRDSGIDIPHFCYHPGLGPDGNCRMCQVEFVTERGNRVGISCKAVVTAGMNVLTQSDSAKGARASVEEFLLLNHPLDCPICDKAGECSLQDYYMEHDLQDSRQSFTRFRKEKAVDIGPTMILDQERCVLCDRCVRFLRDVAGDPQLHIAGRGHSAFITTFPGQEVTSPYSLNTVDLCPVGALTSKDFRFSTPTWYLKNTPTTCTTCARGCSMQMQSKDGKVLRFRPRHNPDVNGYWSCDEGRLNYKFVNEARIHTSVVRRGGGAYEASHEEAITAVRELLGYAPAGKAAGPAKVKSTILASAHCTVEEMFLLKRLAARIGSTVTVVRHCVDGVDDKLLRRADRHPNARGAELLGIPVVDAQHAAASGVLILVGFNFEIPKALLTLAAAAARVVALSACATELTERADVVAPGLTFAEKDGLVVNFEGHVSRVKAGIIGRAVSEWKIIDALLASLDATAPQEFISHVRRAIADSEPAFAAIDLVNIGANGARLHAQAVV